MFLSLIALMALSIIIGCGIAALDGYRYPKPVATRGGSSLDWTAPKES
jgi:hypothetical protein